MWAVSPGHCRTCPEFPWHRVPAMLLDRRGPLLIGFVLQVVEFVLAIVAHLYALLVAAHHRRRLGSRGVRQPLAGIADQLIAVGISRRCIATPSRQPSLGRVIGVQGW
jgi:hypothetical protein